MTATRATEAPPPQRRAAQAAGGAALALLLACLCGRLLVGEVSYRTSAVPGDFRAAPGRQTDEPVVVERMELARVTFAVLLLAAAAIGLFGHAAGRAKLRLPWLGVLIFAFAGWSLAAALNASDKRSALDAWIEQVALLSAFFTAAQICTDRRRFALVAAVLAGLGFLMAVKGAWQIGVEMPSLMGEYARDPARHLAQHGIAPGSPQAEMFEKRIFDTSPTGFGPALANIFATLLIVLLAAGGGLAAAKLIAAARTRRAWRAAAPAGELHLPTLAGVLTAVAAAGVAVVLALTGSRGGIAAAGLAVVAAVTIYLARRPLARHRRKALVIAAGAVVLVGAAVAACGLKYDRLPTKTMTFRWFYWSAGAEMVADRPMLGVGPGNFGAAYLQYRRLPGGEEGVKLPHNVIVHAATQYGLPGGAVYLAILVAVLVLASRPAAGDAEIGQAHTRNRWPWLVGFLACAAAASRGIFTESGANSAVFLIDALAPAAVLASCLVLARWAGGDDPSMLAGPAARVAMGCGLAGFVLHSMVEPGPWMPGAATAFWIAAGACVGRTCPAKAVEPIARPGLSPLWERALAVAGVVVAAAAVAAAVVLLWWPVYHKTVYTEAAVRALYRGRFRRANEDIIWARMYDRINPIARIDEASFYDRLDPIAAADEARVLRIGARHNPKEGGLSQLLGALEAAREAMRLDAHDPEYPRLAAQIQYELAALTEQTSAAGAATEFMARAVALDPQNPHLHLEYANLLVEAGRPKDALSQLDEARRLDAQMYPESNFRLTEAEKQLIETVTRKARHEPR